MKTLQLLSIAALMSALTFGSVPAHAADAFNGVRLLSQQDPSHTKAIKGALTLDEASQKLTFHGDDQPAVVVPFASITSMRVDTAITRLRVPFTGRVEEQEFLTLQYDAPNGAHSYAVFRLNGRSYRETVAALESDTGKKVEQTTK
ncbi:MAG TPA: hypothetical protein VKV02_13130 [Acidobacteriaceae bacterium]|nr:hypothetical protein [Acidobacteriaceae bacterium]